MRHFTILSFLALCGFALSAPNSEDGFQIRSSNECKSVTIIISILNQHKVSATSFCSSFISIPVKTVTSAKVLNLTPNTSTVTETETITPTISITATTTVTPTVAPILTQVLLTGHGEKRDPPPILNDLNAFPPSKISSACSCLSIPASTTTVTTTSAVLVPASTVTVKTAVTNPPVTTTVSEVTVTASTTVTECASPQPTFILKVATSIVVNGTQLQGTYGTIHVDYEDISIRIDRFAFNGLMDSSGAGVLLISQSPITLTGPLIGYVSGFVAVQLLNETGVHETGVAALHFEDPYLSGSSNDVADTCSIAGGVLTCSRAGATILQLCPETSGFNDLFIGPTVGSGCTEVILDVVPVCTPPPATS